MEQLLQKMARQLDSLDEASLMGLWEKYASIVANFEPTKHWEESALIFSFIQAKRWKNQAFNFYWSQQKRPDTTFAPPVFSLESGDSNKESHHAALIKFQPETKKD